MKNTLMAGAMNFAHLLGRAPKAAKKTAEDDRKPEDLDEEKGDGGDEGDGQKDGKKSKRAKAEDPANEEEGEDREQDTDEEDDDDKKSKKAKAKRVKADEEDGEDDDEEGDDGSDGADMRKKSARTARLRERARCAAIFADAAAGKNPALAASLAFGTDLPRGQALNVLRAGGLAVASAPRRPSLDERMAAVKIPAIGAGDVATPAGATNLAAQIVAAGARARGKA
jgi:hypothetical protein